MTRKSKKWFLSLAASVAVLAATPLFAQRTDDKAPARDNPAPARIAAPARVNHSEAVQQQLDSDIASCLILQNQNEVAIAKLAASKTQNEEVKKFAEMLEKDHSAMIAKLQKFTNTPFTDRDTTRDVPAAGAGRENVRPEIRSETRETREAIREDRREGREEKAEIRKEAAPEPRREGAEPRVEVRKEVAEARKEVAEARKEVGEARREGQAEIRGARVEANAAAGNTANEVLTAFRQIGQEKANQCLADARKELSSKESNKFDECFVGMQIAGHMHMITELKVDRRHVSANLGELLASGQTKTEEHLQHAKDLMEKVAKGSK